ncbi:hypothetical protein AVEN_55398-1 [Araneus ventricosus]|uniref:Uncharacterized protein n=1 Tax=Araneus ventricosus TaxID=182803 RepID=A0A4Y2R5P2_ARAVE|nr:hypothetical protein AVEN_55398-1 [Araneus ventricosus]
MGFRWLIMAEFPACNPQQIHRIQGLMYVKIHGSGGDQNSKEGTELCSVAKTKIDGGHTYRYGRHVWIVTNSHCDASMMISFYTKENLMYVVIKIGNG